MTCPVLKTDRLVLRAQTEADFPHSQAMWANPEVVAHIGGKTREAQAVWFAIARGIGMWQLKGFGYFTVESREDGAFVGEVGLSDFKRGLTPDISDWPEAGWVIDAPHWGKGYATEALTAMHQWFDTARPGQATVCLIDEDHPASIRVARKLGYDDWTKTTYNDARVVLMRRAGNTVA